MGGSGLSARSSARPGLKAEVAISSTLFDVVSVSTEFQPAGSGGSSRLVCGTAVLAGSHREAVGLVIDRMSELSLRA